MQKLILLVSLLIAAVPARTEPNATGLMEESALGKWRALMREPLGIKIALKTGTALKYVPGGL
jgi:hypothetical protein